MILMRLKAKYRTPKPAGNHKSPASNSGHKTKAKTLAPRRRSWGPW